MRVSENTLLKFSATLQKRQVRKVAPAHECSLRKLGDNKRCNNPIQIIFPILQHIPDFSNLNMPLGIFEEKYYLS